MAKAELVIIFVPRDLTPFITFILFSKDEETNWKKKILRKVGGVDTKSQIDGKLRSDLYCVYLEKQFLYLFFCCRYWFYIKTLYGIKTVKMWLE